MQLSDLKKVYDGYITENNGNSPKVCKMGPLLFDEFKGFVDPIMDDLERFVIKDPANPRKYMWKKVEVVRYESVQPFKFRFE